MTAYGDINLAVKAMKDGASDFVVKPWENDALQATVRTALTSPFPGVPASAPGSKSAASGSIESPEIIGESAEIQQVFKTIEKVAETEANVLLLGENGTGKELAARSIHLQSKRANHPFVHVDLGAIPESLFESELFGHVRGAFTDAREHRAGRFEAAQGGTLFLDEIGNLSLPLQAKLLTALQSRSITRVGSNQAISVDTRLVCATNMPLYQMVGENRFRQDLIYRINTVEITLPPLRNRKEDIPLLVQHFLTIYRDKYQRPDFRLKPESMRLLQQYTWPGNIRELRHAVERAVIMVDPDSVLRADAGSIHPPPEDAEPDYNLEEVEKMAIIKALAKHQGNISRAAKELGLGRTTLYRKMTKYGL
jgi:DNA-binding NtrC family response regulator